MVETLAILKDTPIPTLMILGGIALLVLSVATQIGDKVFIARERQKGAWIAGLLMVMIGVGLYLYNPSAVAVVTPTPSSPAVVQNSATFTLPAVVQNTPTTTAITPASAGVASATPDRPVVSNCLSQPKYFQEYWSGRIAQLGCPLTASSSGDKVTQQSFERGWMFEREDTRTIYALLADRTYQTFQDSWARGQETYSCPDLAASQTPPTPREGFGVAWCSSEKLRTGLGLAVEVEKSVGLTLQAFDYGLIFETNKGAFLLDSIRMTWEKLR